jgi:hypothetical protein
VPCRAGAPAGISSRLAARARFTRRRLHRIDDLLIAGAAAKIAGQRIAHLGIARHAAAAPPEQLVCRDEHAGRADSALRAAALDERALERREPPARFESFHGDEFGPVRLDCGDEARVHAAAVEQYGAGSALPLTASFLRPGETALVTQHVEQTLHRRHAHLMLAAVHGEAQRDRRRPRAATRVLTWTPPRAIVRAVAPA